MNVFPDLPNITDRTHEQLEEDFAGTRKALQAFSNLGLKMTRHLQGKSEMTQDEYELGCALYYFWIGWQDAVVKVEKNRKTEADPTASSDSVIIMPKKKEIIQ